MGVRLRKGKLKVNDLIIAVDGDPHGNLAGAAGTKRILSVLRTVKEGGVSKEVKMDISIELQPFSYSSPTSIVEQLPEGKIAYLQLESFYRNHHSSSTKEVVDTLKKFKQEHKLKGVILDLRNNFGGSSLEARNILGAFISQGILSVGDSPVFGREYERKTDPEIQWDGPLIVMVNRLSASASEQVAMCLQDYGRALIVGDSFTCGKGLSLIQSTLDRSKTHENGESMICFSLFHTVSGRTPHGIGVESDIVIPSVYAGLQIGGRYERQPLVNKPIESFYDDDRGLGCLAGLFGYHPQPKMTTYEPHLADLKKNSAERLAATRVIKTSWNNVKGPISYSMIPNWEFITILI